MILIIVLFVSVVLSLKPKSLGCCFRQFYRILFCIHQPWPFGLVFFCRQFALWGAFRFLSPLQYSEAPFLMMHHKLSSRRKH
jgi:hypothetical protein